jgi:hypothetical protein
MLLLLFAQPGPVVMSAVAASSAAAIVGCGSGSCVSCCTCQYVCTDYGGSFNITPSDHRCMDCEAECIQDLRSRWKYECEWNSANVTGRACGPKDTGP